MKEFVKRAASIENEARVLKIIELQQTSGFPDTAVADGAGIKRSTYIGYKQGKFATPTMALAGLAEFHKVYLPELIDPDMPLHLGHMPEFYRLYSINNAVINLRVLSMMKDKSYLQMAKEMDVHPRMLERISNGTVVRCPDIYCYLAEYFGKSVESFLMDCTKTWEVHEYFEQLNQRQRIKFIARLHGDKVRREQVSRTGRVSRVGLKEIHLTSEFLREFVNNYQIPLDWIVAKDLNLHVGTSLVTAG